MELNTEKIRQSLFECVILDSDDPHMTQLFLTTETDLSNSNRTVKYLQYSLAKILDEIDDYLNNLRQDRTVCEKHQGQIDKLNKTMLQARKAINC